MNSYNENLHLAIVNSLQSLDIEEQDLNSQINSAMFTLYHAEGATIVAEQNLAAATDANNAVALTLPPNELNPNTALLYFKWADANVDDVEKLFNQYGE